MDLIDDMAYKAIASKYNVKIRFREHAILHDGKLDKKFDFIMLYGISTSIDAFKRDVEKQGGAFVQISRYYLQEESNLMVLVAPDDIIKHTVSTIEKLKSHLRFYKNRKLLDFIDVDLNNEVKLPKFIKSVLKPFYNANEVVLSTILISVEKMKILKKFRV